MCNAKVFAHGDGKCDGEFRISHTMPDWYETPADGKHRHRLIKSDFDYVAVYTEDLPDDQSNDDQFNDCGYRPVRATPRPQANQPAPNPSPPSSVNTPAPQPSPPAPRSVRNPPEPIAPTPVQPDPEPTVPIAEPVAPKPEPMVMFMRWEKQFWKGWNLVSFPVLPEGVETVGDLWHRWSFMEAFNAWIFLFVDDQWLLYTGNPQDKAGALQLQPNHALVIYLDSPSWLGVTGIPLSSKELIEIVPGLNSVGLTDLPAKYARPSDMINSQIIGVLVEQRGKLYLVGRTGDPGDAPLTKGQAMILISGGKTQLDLSMSQ